MLSSLELAFRLSRQRNVRPPERFCATEAPKKATRKLTCPCGAQHEPTSPKSFKWCDKCRVFVSVGGLVRCMCGLAMPPSIDENGANAVDVDTAESDDDLIDWIQCDRCKYFLHVSCVFGPLDASSQLSQQAFVCAMCDGDNDDDDDDDDEPAVIEIVANNAAVISVDDGDQDKGSDNDGALDNESAPKRFYLCNIDGCDYIASRIKLLRSHRMWGHPDRVIDNSAQAATVTLPRNAKVTCRFCHVKTSQRGLYSHIRFCEKKEKKKNNVAATQQQEVQEVPEVRAEQPPPPPQQARKRARTTAIASANQSQNNADLASSAVSAFPESAVRVLGSAADGALEKARRGVLLRKIRAVIELDEAFLQTMNGRYSTHKMATDVHEQQ